MLRLARARPDLPPRCANWRASRPSRELRQARYRPVSAGRGGCRPRSGRASDEPPAGWRATHVSRPAAGAHPRGRCRARAGIVRQQPVVLRLQHRGNPGLRATVGRCAGTVARPDGLKQLRSPVRVGRPGLPQLLLEPPKRLRLAFDELHLELVERPHDRVVVVQNIDAFHHDHDHPCTLSFTRTPSRRVRRTATRERVRRRVTRSGDARSRRGSVRPARPTPARAVRPIAAASTANLPPRRRFGGAA